MNDIIFCNNCGKHGHQYHQCKIPTTSYGIICFRRSKLNNNLEYLMIRRKDTLGYVDFIRGKYSLNNTQHIMNILDEMTEEEKRKLLNEKFATLWCELWGHTSKTGGYQKLEEKISSDKLNQLRNGFSVANSSVFKLETMIRNTPNNWKEPEWGFPKGRRNFMENDLDCAMREWEEESGFSKNNLNLITNVLPFEETFVGSNYKSYKHKYYIAQFISDSTNDNGNDCSSFEKSEIGCMAWKTYENAIQTIRPYNTEKINILNKVNHILSSCNVYD